MFMWRGVSTIDDEVGDAAGVTLAARVLCLGDSELERVLRAVEFRGEDVDPWQV
jgi:hypothetical protein